MTEPKHTREELTDRVRKDCCDMCLKVDDRGSEAEVCTVMTRRCKGDSCARCKPCKAFVAAPRKEGPRVGWL